MYQLYYRALIGCLFLFSFLCSLAAPPSVPSKNLTYTQSDGNSFAVTLVKGNGARRLVIAHKGGPVTSTPSNGNDYNHNQIFGSGDELNAGDFVVYDGDLQTFYVYGLAPNTIYHFAVFEYNGQNFSTEYLTGNFAVGAYSTLSAPTVPASGISINDLNGNSVSINWINGSGTRRLVLMREGAPVQVNPSDLVVYNSSPKFGSGASLGNQTFVVGVTTVSETNTIQVKNLKPSTTYFFKVFEMVGSNGPVYQPAGAPEASFTTLDRPTKHAGNIILETREGNSLGILWTDGNGSRRMVVVTENIPNTVLPADGTDPIPNADFTKAPEIASGHKVVFNGDAKSNFTLTGLTKGKTYYFNIYESSGTGSQTTYLTAGTSTIDFSTCSEPAQPPANMEFKNATPGGVQVSLTPGNGTGRIILVRAGSPVNTVPADYHSYNPNSIFGNGAKLGTDNYVIASGPNSYVNVTGLAPGVTYHYAAFEYNGKSAKVYNLNPLRGSFIQSNRPTTGPSGASLSLIDVSQCRVTWTNGNGQNRLLVVGKGAPVEFVPEDGVVYNANTDFSQAVDAGNGEKIMYYGSSSVADITGLEPGTTYHVRVYEAAGSGAGTRYLTELFAVANGTTTGIPTNGPAQFQAKTVGTITATLKVTGGNGAGRLWIVRENNAVDYEPVDMTNINTSSQFGNNSGKLANGHFAMHQSNAEEVTLYNFLPGKTYHVAVFEYNGGNKKVYNSISVARGSFTTKTRPDQPATNLSFSLADGSTMRVQWARGNGQGRVVVASAGMPVLALPQDGMVYSGNANFALAPELAPGNKIVYAGTGTFVDLTGLSHATNYYFSVFEYAGEGTQVQYLTSAVLTGQKETIGYPTIQASNIQVSSIAANSATIGWTNGNGANRLMLVKKGAPVTALPEQYKNYATSSFFNSAAALPDGSKAVGKTNLTSSSVANLESGTTYFVSVFEFNGNASPAYLHNTPAIGQFTTIGAPIEPSALPLIDQQNGTSLRLRWTPGSGQRRVVVMRAGLPVAGVPVANQRYSANSFFGSGALLPGSNPADESPEYVIYNGPGKEVVITNLDPAVTYHFAIWEFNDFGSSVMYQTIAPLRGEARSAEPLPLKLGHFKGRITGKNIRLDWSTLQETNTHSFEIEVSYEQRSFLKLATVAAAGNSQAKKDYNWSYVPLENGTAQFRLKMIDKDGKFAYSPVILLQRENAVPLTWTIQSGQLVVQTGNLTGASAKMLLYSSDGRHLYTQAVINNQTVVAMNRWPKGIYHVVVQSIAGKESVKILW